MRKKIDELELNISRNLLDMTPEVSDPNWKPAIYRQFESVGTSAELDGVFLSESETRIVIEVMGAMRDLMP